MKREHLARRLAELGTEQRRRREAFVLALPWEVVESKPPLPRVSPKPEAKPEPRRRARPPTPRRVPATAGGRSAWYSLTRVPMRVRVARWALGERDDASSAAATINRAAADLADELEPIGLAPEVTPYRPQSSAARERDRLL